MQPNGQNDASCRSERGNTAHSHVRPAQDSGTVSQAAQQAPIRYTALPWLEASDRSTKVVSAIIVQAT